MTYVTGARIRFGHVDAAGIVFYPRYFELINGAVEDFCADCLGADFATLHIGRKIGMPVVKVEATFMAPSRLHDWLDIHIDVREVGSSSCVLDFRLSVGGEARVRASTAIVCTDMVRFKAMSWPEDLRAALKAQLERSAGAPKGAA